MDEHTRKFLDLITSMLREQFSSEASAGYLNELIDHLKTFYEDVVSELEARKEKREADIKSMYI